MDNYTHAGGIVFRKAQGQPEYLLVTSKKQPTCWIFPKGHIEPAETPAQTAVREVLEESGAQAKVLNEAGALQWEDGAKKVNCIYYLMECTGETENSENRRKEWLAFEQALNLLSFENSRNLLRSADQQVKKITSA